MSEAQAYDMEASSLNQKFSMPNTPRHNSRLIQYLTLTNV